MTATHRLFVYGNFLPGEPDHELLAEAEHVGGATTVSGYKLVERGTFAALVIGWLSMRLVARKKKILEARAPRKAMLEERLRGRGANRGAIPFDSALQIDRENPFNVNTDWGIIIKSSTNFSSR